MENTTPGPLKNNLTSTPCMKRKSLFTAPDVSPIKTGTSTKRNSATTIVSKIPVKLTSRKLLTKIPRLSGQTKTSETEKPVLRTIDNNDQADATTNKGKKGNKCPKVSAPNKEASSSKNVSSSTINKKNDNLSNMDWEEMEVLSHEVLDPVSKKGSNLDVDLDGDDDDDGDFELSKKGKKCLSPKKAKQADSKGADKKPAKSARGKKKADAEDTEVLLENIPEETKINSKMQLDGEAANKIAETRKALKKAPNKDPKKPLTRNKKKTADSDLEPVIEESNDADDEKKAVTRNKRKSVGGNLGTLAEEPMIIDVEDEPKSPVRNKKRTFDLGTVAEEQENVRDQKDSSPKTKNDLGPVADKKKNAEDQHETPTRKKSKSAYSDEKAKEPVQVEGPKKRTTRNMKKNADSNASASEPIAEIEPIDVEIEEQPAQTRKIARAKKMRADKKEKNCLSEPSVEVPEKDENEEVLNSDEKAIEVDESEPAPKRRRNKKNQDDIKEVSVAFSEMGEKENEESKEPQPKSKTDTTVKTNSRKQKSTALSEIPSNAQPSTSAEPAETTVNKLRKQKVAAMDGIPSNPQPSTSSEASGSCPVKKKDVKFDSFNATGGKRQIPLNRIFGSPFVTDSEVSPTPVKVFRSIKPSENVMGGFISILAGSSHNGFSTNYNMYFLMSDTQLKVNIMGVEKNIENQLTSFVVPKDCRFSIENVGSGTAVLSFTKLRSI